MNKKLNTTFKINPLYEADGYKVGHKEMLAKGTTRLAGTWIPRSLKYMDESIDKAMSAGQQFVVRYLHSTFQEFFFDQDIKVALQFAEDMTKYLGLEYDGKHFEELHKLGYLPFKVKALPEGVFTNPNIPHMFFINTVDGYAWLTLFLETFISKLSWQISTVATIANKFKQNSVEWVKKTDEKNMWFADFANHDFHSRGGNPFTSMAAGLGHAFSNKGSDTLNIIPAARYYYDVPEDEVCINSVNASEHSVTCTGIFYYQDRLKKGQFNKEIEEYYSFDAPCEGSVQNPDYLAIAEWLNLRDWLVKFPKGILSVVSDTFDLWKLITFILPRLKKEILGRDGKLVIRPDSGNPVDIICGLNTHKLSNLAPNSFTVEHEDTPEWFGVIELLWMIFGGTTNEQGYKILDPHIGAIYGDSINLERQIQIYKRLAIKGFAATNIVLGVGSFSYVYLTRDNMGFAAKGCWFETKSCGEGRQCICKDNESCLHPDIEQFNIYKDPITDDGTKKSLKGFILVKFDGKDYVNVEEVSEELWDSTENELKDIYIDGKFYNEVTLEQVRERIKKN